MTAKQRMRRVESATARAFRDDPMVLGGHIGIIVTASGLLTWQVARIDLASRRMVFEHSGAQDAPKMGGGWLTHCLLHASETAFDRDPFRPQ